MGRGREHFPEVSNSPYPLSKTNNKQDSRQPWGCCTVWGWWQQLSLSLLPKSSSQQNRRHRQALMHLISAVSQKYIFLGGWESRGSGDRKKAHQSREGLESLLKHETAGLEGLLSLKTGSSGCPPEGRQKAQNTLSCLFL